MIVSRRTVGRINPSGRDQGKEGNARLSGECVDLQCCFLVTDRGALVTDCGAPLQPPTKPLANPLLLLPDYSRTLKIPVPHRYTHSEFATPQPHHHTRSAASISPSHLHNPPSALPETHPYRQVHCRMHQVSIQPPHWCRHVNGWRAPRPPAEGFVQPLCLTALTLPSHPTLSLIYNDPTLVQCFTLLSSLTPPPTPPPKT